VIAGTDAANVERAQRLFHGGALRVYTSSDLAGVELAGSLKNVVALAAGIADGFALGDNAKAGIITRGIAEITRLGVAAGAEPATFAGLAGVGDTIATCYSPLSRNRRCGEAIARGATVADAIASAGGVVEGAEATAAACLLADRYGIEMPIACGLRSVLFEGAAPQEAIRRLLEREPAREDA
jgi:glycerol-3-phosphate dehydrogenase (NAD(P)+)